MQTDLNVSPYTDSKFIGYVLMVSPSLTKIHFPSSVLLKKFYDGDEGLHALVGEYVIIEGTKHGFLGRLIEISVTEKERLELSESKFEREAFHPIGKIELLLCFDNFNVKSKKGLDRLPPAGAKVFLCSGKFLSKLLVDFGKKEGSKSKMFELGTLPHDYSHKVNIAFQALFGRHCAVVGTTGSGKSWTVSKLIQELGQQSGKVILIDPTGEYENLNNASFDYYKFNSDDIDSVFFSYRKLKETDLFALFRPSQQIQLPKLQEAIKSLRLVNKLMREPGFSEKYKFIEYNEANDRYNLVKKESDNTVLGILKKHPEVYHSTCDFDIQALSAQIIKECGIEIRTKEMCSSLIARMLLTINEESFERIFDFKNEKKEANEFASIVTKFLNDDMKNVLIVSVANVPTENKLREILVNAIGRFLYAKAVNKEFKQSNKSIVLFLDEAHLFLNKNIKDEYSIEVELDSYERIAKECRKFGLFLVLSTQMPRDIPRGVFSQMGTFVVHRLINQFDREAIEYACSEASKSSLSFLPILSEGEAILAGVDFPVPIIIKIDEPKNKPDSSTPLVV